MAKTQTLHDAFVDELKDSYDAEKQLTKALPKLARASGSPDLRQALEDHLEETRGHVDKLEQVFQSIDQKARRKHCDGMAGIIDEGTSVMSQGFDGATLDAALIASAQRAEHYEIAAYGTLLAWAKAMGHGEAAELLQEILDEEKAADERLNAIAESGVNEEAVSGMEAGKDDDEAAPARSARRSAAAASISRRTPRKRR